MTKDKRENCGNCRWFRYADFFKKTLYGFIGDIDRVKDACGINEKDSDPQFGVITGTSRPVRYPFVDKEHHCGEWEAANETK